jgi:hypothetical protein
LKQHRVEAVVISDETGEAGRRVERLARQVNPGAVIVRTVTGVSNIASRTAGVVCLEKPFDLRELAAVLGVPNADTR